MIFVWTIIFMAVGYALGGILGVAIGLITSLFIHVALTKKTPGFKENHNGSDIGDTDDELDAGGFDDGGGWGGDGE